MKSIRSTIAVFILLHSLAAHALTRSFAGSVSNDWSTAANWSPAGAPDASDDVVIPAGKIVDLASTATVTRFAIEGTLTGSGTLTVSGNLVWSAGAMLGSGTTNALGPLQINGDTAKTLARTLNNAATADWSGNGELNLADGGVLHNRNSGTIRILNDQVIRAGSGQPRIENEGVIVKMTADGTTTILNVELNNSGSVVIESGKLELAGNGTHSGSFAAAGGTLEFSAGTHTLPIESSISGANCQFTGAAVAHDGAYEVTDTRISGGTVVMSGLASGLDTLELNGGVWETHLRNAFVQMRLFVQSDGLLTGNSVVIVSGPLTWRGGEMAGFGITNANGGVILDPQQSPTLARLLTNFGSGAWTSAGFLLIAGGGVFENRPASRFEIQAQAGILTAGGAPRVENNGTFIHNTTSVSQLNGVAFLNQGSVEVNSGTLRFDGGYQQSAGVTRLGGGSIKSNLPLQINGGVVLGPGTIDASLINAGAIDLTAPGLLQVNGNYTQTATGILQIGLGGGADESLGILATQSATLAGSLSIQLVGGFAPQLGDTFSVVRYASAIGEFTSFSPAPLPPGLMMTRSMQATQVVVAVTVEDCGAAACTPVPTPTPTASPTSTPIGCSADCDGSSGVSIDDYLIAIAIALEQQQLESCSALDRDASGGIEVDELVAATIEPGC